MATVDTIVPLALQLAGDETPLRDYTLVSGGMISQAARIVSGRGVYLLKWGGQGLADFFAVEAHGLETLAAIGALRVPTVLAHHDPTPTTNHRPLTTDKEHETGDARHETADQGRRTADETGFILLEWIEAPSHADQGAVFEALGRQLAALHRSTAPAYGLDHDNYLGIMPQHNGWMERWPAFFRERRLRVQAEIARSKGHLSGERARRMDRLLDRLDSLLGEHQPPASLLHGDLWGGNVLVGPGGAPALIDPAVSYGDRESELAYTALFGGFPEGFYRAYEAAWPLPGGWQERRELYNLYHLVNHLNHFGERYGAHVDGVLRRYVG
jgi:fructosamine-3-kinase